MLIIIDVTNASGALQFKGTVATGPFKGIFTYKVYLKSKTALIMSILFMNIQT